MLYPDNPVALTGRIFVRTSSAIDLTDAKATIAESSGFWQSFTKIRQSTTLAIDLMPM